MGLFLPLALFVGFFDAFGHAQASCDETGRASYSSYLECRKKMSSVEFPEDCNTGVLDAEQGRIFLFDSQGKCLKEYPAGLGRGSYYRDGVVPSNVNGGSPSKDTNKTPAGLFRIFYGQGSSTFRNGFFWGWREQAKPTGRRRTGIFIFIPTTTVLPMAASE